MLSAYFIRFINSSYRCKTRGFILKIPALKLKKPSFKRSGPYLLAFLLPVFVMCIVFLERGFYPFGDRCFLRTDLYHQYAPFFQELKKKLAEGGSLFYDWNIGAGTNFWALSAYYLASPLNLLVVLCPQKYIIEFITFMIVNKQGLCSLTVAYYLNKRHHKTGLAAYPAAFFGTFYALSGYMAAYQWNIMWLDCLWLFPLVIMGLERLVKENKGLLYGVTLGLSILSNYYIAVMVCMGIAVYCFFLLGTVPEMRKDFGVKLLKFIGYTILALLFSSVFLIPYIRYFSMTASADSSFRWEWYSYFPVFDMASRHLFSVEVHTGLDHWPNIYCGVMIFLGLPLYYLNKKISLREKLGYTLVLIFFYFSFSTRSMDYIWHVFHIPNSLPCRQAFIYVFLLMIMCYRGFIGIKDRSFRDITFTLVAALVFVFMAEKFQTDETYYHNYVFYGSAVFLILYTILIYLYRRGRSYKDVLLIVLIALCCIENVINTSVTSIPTVGRSDYTSFDSGVRSIMKTVRADEDENNFYRVEKVSIRTKNDGAWLDYPSLSTFSSVANKNLTAFYKILGMESSTNAYGSTGQTPFTDMLLDVKYLIAQKEMAETGDLYIPYDNNGANVWFYKNRYTLPLGYVVNSESLKNWDTAASTPLLIQNDLAERISGISDLFEDVTPLQDMALSITIPIQEDGFYYAYSTKTGPKNIQVTHDDFSKKFTDLNRSYTMDLGWCKAGDSVSFKNPDTDSDRKIDVKLYKFHPEYMEYVYEAFTAGGLMEIDSFKDTRIEAHIDVKQAGTLFTSISQEEGWDVYVDGEKVEYGILKDAYITLDLDEGYHTLSFRFHVPLFGISLVLTILAFLAFLAIGILKKTDLIPRLIRKQLGSPDGTGLTDDAGDSDAFSDGSDETARDDAFSDSSDAFSDGFDKDEEEGPSPAVLSVYEQLNRLLDGPPEEGDSPADETTRSETDSDQEENTWSDAGSVSEEDADPAEDSLLKETPVSDKAAADGTAVSMESTTEPFFKKQDEFFTELDITPLSDELDILPDLKDLPETETEDMK